MAHREPYSPPPSELPASPHPEALRKLAKSLLAALRAGDDAALDLLARHHPDARSGSGLAGREPTLSDAQLVLARHLGHPSWPRLMRHVGFLRESSAARLRRFVRCASTDSTGPGDEAYRLAVRLLEADPSLAETSDHAALVLGDADRVRARLRDDAAWADAPGGPYPDRRPLHYVTYSRFWRRSEGHARGLLECARLLLDAGADPDARFTPGEGGGPSLSALLGACGVAHFPEMARLLLERGADPDDGESLYHSVEFAELTCFEILLEHGVTTRCTNALNHSLDFADPTATRRLLEYGADPNEQTEFNGAPLHWAISRGREVERLRLLVEFGADPVATRSRDGRTPYAVAAQTGHRDAMRYLESIDAATPLSPLDEFIDACSRADVEGARELLERHPDLLENMEPADLQGFHRLAERGRAGTLRTALAAGLPPDLSSHGGQTLLHWACWHGREEVARLLLDAGAPIEQVESEFGCTPLLWAAHGSANWPAPDGDYPAVVKLLLERGADVGLSNKWDEGAISLAREAPEVVSLLREAGAPEPPDPVDPDGPGGD